MTAAARMVLPVIATVHKGAARLVGAVRGEYKELSAGRKGGFQIAIMPRKAGHLRRGPVALRLTRDHQRAALAAHRRGEEVYRAAVGGERGRGIGDRGGGNQSGSEPRHGGLRGQDEACRE